jgi:hypothetical protein
MDGCGFEQHLEAMERALVKHRHGDNAGFLRDDSILVVIILTDEDDCSVAPGHEDIFDYTRIDYGHLSLRCIIHPEKVEPVETYIEVLRTIRPDPERLVLGVIAGVPPGPACEGRGTDIGSCLEHDEIQYVINPETMTTLVPSCTTSSGEAHPARRLVELALGHPDSSCVHSICTDDFRPVLRNLAGIVAERIRVPEPDGVLPPMGIEINPALCGVNCTLEVTLPGSGPCPGLPCVEDGAGDCLLVQDEEGHPHSVCYVPQAATRMTYPERGCADPDAVHVPTGGFGWYYIPDREGGSGIRFSEGVSVPTGSEFELRCCFDQ